MQNTPYKCSLSADILYPGETARRGSTDCIIGKHIKFESSAMQSFVPNSWQPIIYDVMLLVAAVEICDRSKARSGIDWRRDFSVQIPVHDPDLWNDSKVKTALIRALQILTGDVWQFDFRQTPEPQRGPSQRTFEFPSKADTIIPFSDGLDSRAVAAIMAANQNSQIIRVRVGANRIKKLKPDAEVKPFGNVPFSVKKVVSGNGESSGRSRGFKFAMLAGLAAYLTGADRVVVPESGQGALGPVLVNVGQSYFDRRNHPQFTFLMSHFLEILFGKHIAFIHPVIWQTKGQTLSQYREIHPSQMIWKDTRSCWMSQRHSSLNGDHRQCGFCAACMLRRMSLHKAGYDESPDKYVCGNLGAPHFWDGVHPDFKHRTNAQWEYAIAGTLHMDHLAALRTAENLDKLVMRQALPLAQAMGISVDDALTRILGVIEAHADEWFEFLDGLPADSFVRNWAEAA